MTCMRAAPMSPLSTGPGLASLRTPSSRARPSPHHRAPARSWTQTPAELLIDALHRVVDITLEACLPNAVKEELARLASDRDPPPLLLRALLIHYEAPGLELRELTCSICHPL
jgi:hypothetical protein